MAVLKAATRWRWLPSMSLLRLQGGFAEWFEMHQDTFHALVLVYYGCVVYWDPFERGVVGLTKLDCMIVWVLCVTVLCERYAQFLARPWTRALSASVCARLAPASFWTSCGVEGRGGVVYACCGALLVRDFVGCFLGNLTRKRYDAARKRGPRVLPLSPSTSECF